MLSAFCAANRSLLAGTGAAAMARTPGESRRLSSDAPARRALGGAARADAPEPPKPPRPLYLRAPDAKLPAAR